MTRYKDLQKIRELTRLVKTKKGHSKLIQTGQLGFCDYGVGFLELEVYYWEDKGKHFVRIWLGTIDDGDFGGWREMSSKDKALKLIDKMVDNVFKDMVAFPTKEELNKKLIRYGIAVDYE
jgi:hypothetical protein